MIGGAACNLLEEELEMNPRATKDLDLVLVVEALTPDFGMRLWDFIKEGNYESMSFQLLPMKMSTSPFFTTHLIC